MIRRISGAAAAAALLLATAAQAAEPAAADLTRAPRMGPWGYDAAGRDPAVRPQDDFYQHANGAFLERLQIPADRSRYGMFDQLIELSQARLRAVLDKAAADPAARGEAAQIGGLYKSFLDEARVDALGAKPLRRGLAAIRAARSRSALAGLMGRAQHGFGGGFFNAMIFDDAKDPQRYAVYLFQGGLGLPDRDYYMQPQFAAQRAAYEAYVARLLTLAGWKAPGKAAKDILALETEIAKVSWTRVDRRDDDKTYNAMETARLAAFAPGFDWAAYLRGAGLAGTQRVVLAENSAFPKIAAIFAAAPVETLQAWAAFSLADNAAPYLSKAFSNAHYEMHERTLSGQPQPRPRWKRGVALVDRQLGEAMGKVYVAAYFPADSKARMQALVADLRTAMKGRIERVAWMSPATRAKALEKLEKFTVKIGYPSRWRDYSGLAIRPDDLYGNLERAFAFDWRYRVGRLNGPVDREEWGMTPQTVNAYYQSTKNEIVFPAAILQPPFFDPEADPAINYGAIGAIIGHEITHGFDDQGRKSDGDGRLADWWTPEDAEKFKAEAAKLGKQYAAVEAAPGAHVNGELTMGENIADLGGLLMALDAYRLSLGGRPAPVIAGLTGDQRVFLGWAQAWRSKTREARVRELLVSDPHSPEPYRVNLPMRNIDSFYEAFGVGPGDGMFLPPEQRARIW